MFVFFGATGTKQRAATSSSFVFRLQPRPAQTEIRLRRSRIPEIN